MRVLATCWIGVMILSIGCGDSTAAATADTAAAEPVFYNAAVMSSSAVVLSLHADSADASTYGPPLPLEGPADDYVLSAYALADGRVLANAISNFTDPTGTISYLHPSVAWVGDGTSWRTIVVDSCAVTAVPSPGGTLARVAHLCGENVSLVSVDAGDGGAASVVSGSLSVFAVAPDDSYALLESGDGSGGLVLRSLVGSGADVSLPPQYIAGNVSKTFATSFLVSTGDGATAWFDDHGSPLTVAGFVGAANTVGLTIGGAAFQVTNGQLAILADRSVQARNQVAASTAVADVMTFVAGSYTVTSPGTSGKVVITGADGAVRSTALAAGAQAQVSDEVEDLGSDTPWFIAGTILVDPPGSDVGPWVDTEYLVLPGADGSAPVVTTLFQGDQTRTATVYWASPGGRYLLYVSGSDLHAVDVVSHADRQIGAGYSFKNVDISGT